MKKYFIFAAAAVVAMSSCTKVETDFNIKDPGNKIAFQVANYSARTKAGDETSLATGEDALFSFNTYANQFPEIGDAATFMNNEEIKAWDNTPAVVTSGTDIYSWAPEVDYFWPKTGYINFYSYAGTVAPAATISADKKTVTFAYTDKTIAATDNILVADAALHFSANTNPAKYGLDNVAAGVPTLFRHQLAKIKFTVHLKTEKPASANTVWTVRVIDNETISGNACKSAITFVNKGSLTLVNADALAADAAKNITEQAWTANPAGDVSGWVASTAAADKDEVVFTTQTLTIPVNEQESQETDPAILIAERSVLPQITDNTTFVLYYEVSATHTGDSEPFLKEVRTVGVDVAKSLKDLVSSIDDWTKNTKITYNVIIDPVSEKVLFDPAVEAWAEESGDINVPIA